MIADSLGPMLIACFYAFTCCVFIPGYSRKGKARPLFILQTNSEFKKVFKNVGNVYF